MASSPDFAQNTKEVLAKRAGQVCSNPDCRKPTAGPHSDDDRAVNLGEAAHIKGARPSSARYDPAMTDEERRNIKNGIWLCCFCAKLVDNDAGTHTVTVLCRWKEEHEAAVLEREKTSPAAKEIIVKAGGIGSIVNNTGEGCAEEIIHDGPGPAQRTTVQGKGVGEIITNTGPGTAKRIISKGGGPAAESIVDVTEPVQRAVGLSSKLVLATCKGCGRPVQFTKVVQAYAADAEPKGEVKCPHCGMASSI